MIHNHGSCSTPRVWILLGDRLGDNNQLFALAEAIGLPFEAKQIAYNWVGKLAFLRDERLLYVTRAAKQRLVPPWPDIVIGLGYASMPVARYVRTKSGGKTKHIHLGNPRTDLSKLDLVLTTPQYSLEQADNVVLLPLPIGNPAKSVKVTDEEKIWLENFPSPRRLVAVGGSTKQWTIDPAKLTETIRHLQAQRKKNGGSVIAVTSPRTQPSLADALEAQLTDSDGRASNFPRFAALLAECDEFHVTADSVSMLAEAILTGKPVAMIPINRSLRGRIGDWLRRHVWDFGSNSDMAQFWQYLITNNLVGDVRAPVASKVADSTGLAVQAVRRLLENSPRKPLRKKQAKVR